MTVHYAEMLTNRDNEQFLLPVTASFETVQLVTRCASSAAFMVMEFFMTTAIATPALQRAA